MMRRVLVAGALVLWPAVGAAQVWQAIQAEAARCAKGGAWNFWVHRGQPDRLLVYLQGGGGCWLKANCDLADQPTFDPVVEERDSPANADGILAIDRPANPFRGWTVVYIPYCTADVHLGARQVDYAGVAMDHRGAANAAVAMQWIGAEIKSPREIVVTGGSAGAIPVPVYATRLAARFPKARVTGIGDGAGGYRAPTIPGILAGWGVRQALSDVPAFAAIDSAGLTFESLYIAAGRANPKLRLAQINQDHDAIQLQFLTLLGVPGTPLAPLLQANLDDIQAALPAFRRYLIPSEEHTILTRPGFYTTVVNGVPLADWVAATIDAKR